MIVPVTQSILYLSRPLAGPCRQHAEILTICFGAGGEASEPPPTCAVCLDDFSDGSEVGRTPVLTPPHKR